MNLSINGYNNVLINRYVTRKIFNNKNSYKLYLSSNDDNRDIKVNQDRLDDDAMDVFLSGYMEEGSVEDNVKKLMGEPATFNDDGPSPDVKFNKIYNDIKSNKKSNKTLDATAMLQELFPPPDLKNPFDERKIMMKLKNSMNEEDFKQLFLDKNIGDIF